MASLCARPSITEFREMNAYAADMLIGALIEEDEAAIKLRVTLAKIAGGAKVL